MDKMNELEYNHQVFILNGQPVIIQRNQDSNTTGIITENSGIQLRRESHSTINESSESSQLEINRSALIRETNDETVSGNQFVAYVGDSEEEDVPTIHITLEQAAELGLQFDSDVMKSVENHIPVVSESATLQLNKHLMPFSVFTNKSTTVANETLELSVFNERKILSSTDVCDRIPKSVTSGDSGLKMTINESIVGSLNLDGSDQQITLIPHIANGTITYSVQVNSTGSFTEGQLKPEKKIMNRNVPPNPTVQIGDFDSSIIDSGNYNNGTLKSFTTCSDLTSFVESNLDTSSSQQSLNSNDIESTSENVIGNSNEGNITFTSDTVNDCSNKSSTVNFTPLSDLLKCNNILNCNKSGSQSNLLNYQPVSLTQLINSINKNQTRLQQSQKMSTPLTFSGQTLLKTSSSNSSESNNTCNLSDKNSASLNVKSNSGEKIAVLKSKPGLSSNSLVLNGGNISIVKTTVSTSNHSSVLQSIDANGTGKTMLLQTLPKIPVDVNSHNTIDNGLTSLPTANASKSIAAVVPLMRNHVVLNSTVGDNVVNPNASTAIANNAVFPSVSTSSSSDFKTINMVTDNTSMISNKNGIDLLSPVTESCIVSGYPKQSACLNASQVAVMVSSSKLTGTVPPTSVHTCTTMTVTAATGPTTTTKAINSLSPIITSVKALDNKCVLPKEVSAALNRLPLLNDTGKPLGSSENPIQLVQQGQTFHSAQALTADQLKQVTTVLQQNNLGTNIPAKNILYDAETNTKIIYRVVYPEEFDLKEPSMSTDEVNGKTKKRGRPSLKSLHSKDSGSAIASEESSAVVKRKQPLPRTRSGRLSRPPRYMVRDYKRIKRSELDDSDGAYSDYQSEHEEDNASGDKNLLPGLLLPQKRNISSTFRCPTCNKIYLGYRRMAHHFDKYSDHGTEEYLLQLKKACENKQMPYNSNAAADCDYSENPFFKSCGSMFASSKSVAVNASVVTSKTTNNDVNSMSLTDSATPVKDGLSSNLSDNSVLTSLDESTASFPSNRSKTLIKGIKIGTGYGRKRGKRKTGKETVEGVLSEDAIPRLSPDQIKIRLRELLELCDVTQLVQVAGPAVCSVLTTWELLLLRVDSMCTQQNRVTALCDEIKTLLNRFKELASSLFQPVDNVIKNNCNSNITFEMEDKVVSNAFGLPCGLYKINDSLLKTEQIIDACRSKTSSTDWEERSVVSDKMMTDTKDLPSSDEGINVIEDCCLMDDGLNVFGKPDNLLKKRLPEADNKEKKDGSKENPNDCNMTGERLISSNITGAGVRVNICNENDTCGSATDLPSGQYVLQNDSEMLCEERDGLDVSVEQIVNEQLKNLTSQNQDLSKAEVEELMKGFTVLEHRHGRNEEGGHHDGMVQIRTDRSVVLDPSDDLMDTFTSITDQRNHVSASTEDLIKSLENFSSELHNSTCDETSRSDFMNSSVNFCERVVGVNNVRVEDTLDFDVLSQDFHHSNSVNDR